MIDYKTGKVRDDHKPGQLRGAGPSTSPLPARGRPAPRPSPRARHRRVPLRDAARQFKRIDFDGRHLSERRAELEDLLEGITGGIQAGVFLRTPQNKRQCEWCDFDSVCPSNRFRQIDRKSGDERHEAFLGLRAIE